jgi:hypothetical protein
MSKEQHINCFINVNVLEALRANLINHITFIENIIFIIPLIHFILFYKIKHFIHYSIQFH